MNQRGIIAYVPGTAKDFVLCRKVKWTDRDEARAVLLRRYFKAFGPATMDDCAYFTGWKKREILDVIEKSGVRLKSTYAKIRNIFSRTACPIWVKFRGVSSWPGSTSC
jgi:hypothetical protein